MKKKARLSDIFFIALIALMLIPATRTGIRTFLSRITLRNPIEKQASLIHLQPDDYYWEFFDYNERRYTLGELKGELIFLNFWATWCPPCRAELPSIQSLYADYKDSVCFIFVSTEEKEKVTRFLESKEYSIPGYGFSMKPPDKLYSQSIPATYIISPSGEILIQHFGAADWDSQSVRALLNRNFKK